MGISIQGFLNNKELFSVRSISKGLDILPFRAGLIGRLGWFQEQGIPNSLSIVERRFTNIQLLSPHRRGGATSAFDIARRSGIPVEIPQYDTVADVSNADVVNLRKFDGGYSFEDLQTLIMKTSKDQVDVALEPTLEYARIGSLGGKTYNGDGSVAIDWDSLLGITRPTSTFAQSDFDESTTNGWIDTIQAAAGGCPYDSLVCLCGTSFWAAIITNPVVREAFLRWNGSAFNRGELWGNIQEVPQFDYQGIHFIKYPAYSFGTGLSFPAAKAYIFPIGVPGKFMTQYGIGDFNELRPDDVGLKYYAKLKPNEFDRGMKIYLQSNALIYDAFPETTIEATVTA